VTSPSASAPKLPAITVGLRPFSSYPPAVSALLATVCALPGGDIRFKFALEGRLEALRLPVADAPPSGPLWQHTCFEAFISTPDAENYREYNFSTAGQWAAYEFLHYREMGHPLGEEPPALLPVTSSLHENRLTLVADVPSMLLPYSAVLRLGLSTVVEREDGNLEYWAVHHPAEYPDFHHADGWTLLLDTQLVNQ